MKKKLFKQGLSLLVSLALLVGLVPPVSAADNSIRVQLNGENLSFDVAPQMVNERVMVPMRTIYEKLGADVEWDGKTKVITANKAGVVVKLQLKSLDASVTKNQVEKKVKLDSAPTIVDGRTLVPVRFISESLGKQVGWDWENKTVVIIDYDYFLNELKTQGPNFYEFITNRYEAINTGESKQNLEGTYKYDPANALDTSDPDSMVGSGKIDTTFKGEFDTKLNKENGSLDANIKLTGLQELLKGSGLENFDNYTFNVLFDNDSFYVKSNLFSLLEKQNIKVGDKWIQANIADMNIPDVKNLQDLKKQQGNQTISDSFANLPADLDVNSFKEAQRVFKAIVPLVDNKHFTVTKNGDLTTYKWNITKQDLVNVALSIEKDAGLTKDMTLKELAEMKEFVDNLAFDFNLEIGVKQNIVINSKMALTTKMDIPEKGHVEMSIKSTSQVLNPNNGSYNIKIPDPTDVINYKDLQPDYSMTNIS